MNPSRDLPITVYTPESGLAHPLRLITALFLDLWRGRELAWRLFLRDLSAQYRQTYFGYLWAVLPPLVTSLTFIFLNSQGITRIESGSMPYAAFAMIGTLLWQVFVDALASPSQSLLAAKSMLTKINFPREAVLMGGLMMVAFHFMVRLLLLAAVMAWWRIPLGPELWWFVPAVAGLLLTGFAVGLAITPLAGLYGDFSRAIPILGGFWMLLTPVVYPVRTEGLAGVLAIWNPVSPLIVTARESLTAEALTMGGPALVVGAGAGGLALLGLLAFRLAMPHLIARMGG